MKINTVFFRLFIDLRFALLILISIAGVTALGTIIEQDQSLNYYMEFYPKGQGFISYSLILGLGLDHIYRSWLFLSLVVSLGVSLTLCTFYQQLPNIQISREVNFLKNVTQFSKLSLVSSFSPYSINSFVSKALRSLRLSNFYIYQQKTYLYALKGLFGKIGPVLVHISLVSILFGALSGACGRYFAQEFIPKGEIIHIQNLLGAGWFAKIPLLNIRLNDFWVEYNTQKINQFYSNVSLLDSSGKEMINQVLSVNHPLFFEQVFFYQTDWDLLGLRIQQNGEQIFQYPVVLINKTPKVWASIFLDSVSSTKQILIIEDLRQSLKLYNDQGLFVRNINLNDQFSLGNNMYTLVDIIPETGLQIKYDPSIPLTFFGFGLLMISTLLSYLTYSEIWFYLGDNKFYCGAQTTRAKSEFQVNFLTLIKILKR